MKKIASALKELEDHEYLCRERKCSEDTGRVIDWVYTVSDEKLPENILRNSFRRKNPNMKETVTDCSEKITPESHYPHIHNADVAESHMEYPHEENPHLSSMGIYYTNKNQISKKEISSDFNINQSNQQPFDAETSNPDGYDAIEIYKQVINEKICYDSLMHDFSDPECKFPGSAEVLTEIRDRS